VALVMGASDSRLWDGFDDGAELLAAAERMGLEGVVSKRHIGREPGAAGSIVSSSTYSGGYAFVRDGLCHLIIGGNAASSTFAK